jgi:hypothetical protein
MCPLITGVVKEEAPPTHTLGFSHVVLLTKNGDITVTEVLGLKYMYR